MLPFTCMLPSASYTRTSVSIKSYAPVVRPFGFPDTLAALGMRLDEGGQVEVLSEDVWPAYVEAFPRDARPQAPASLAGHEPR